MTTHTLYDRQLARIDRTKQFKADTLNTELMLTRHFNKILGKSKGGTENVFVSKKTGFRSDVCQTCNFDVYATERGIDLNAGFDVVKNPLGQGFNIKQHDVLVPLSPQKLTNIRELIKSREALIHQGQTTSFDATKDTSITVDTSKPASRNVNFSGLTTTINVPTISKSSNPTNNEFNLNEVKNQEVIYGSESLDRNQEDSKVLEASKKIVAGGVASGSALAIAALALLLLKRGKKK